MITNRANHVHIVNMTSYSTLQTKCTICMIHDRGQDFEHYRPFFTLLYLTQTWQWSVLRLLSMSISDKVVTYLQNPRQNHVHYYEWTWWRLTSFSITRFNNTPPYQTRPLALVAPLQYKYQAWQKSVHCSMSYCES